MNARENFLAVMHHRVPEWVPVYSRPVRWNVGFLDEFEKGPAGGGTDGFGVRWNCDDSGPVPATDSFQVTDITAWRAQTHFPDLDAIDWAAKAARELEGADRENCVVEYSMGNGPFERMLAILGFEALTYAFYEEPEACHDYLAAWLQYKLHHIDLVAEHYRPDMISVFDDVAYEYGLFLSLDTYREFISPIHAACNERIRSYGILPIQHCCGKAEVLVEDFIAEGAVAWSSVQPTNDIAGILQKYGDRLSIIGGYDTNGLPSQLAATEEMRRAEVRRAMDAYAPYGSFMISNLIVSGVTPADARERNRQLADEAARYGRTFYQNHPILRGEGTAQ